MRTRSGAAIADGARRERLGDNSLRAPLGDTGFLLKLQNLKINCFLITKISN